MREVKRILVGIDYSEYSREAARYALYLAEHLKADVDFLHICDLPAYVGSGYGPYQLAPVKNYINKQKELESASLDEMKRFIGEFDHGKVTVNYHVTSGNAPAEVIRFAEELKVDLIVVGTHGRAGLSQLLLGSVAEKVVRKARRPVLTVKLTNQDFIITG